MSGLVSAFQAAKVYDPQGGVKHGNVKMIGSLWSTMFENRPVQATAHPFIGRAEQRDVGLSVWYYYYHAALSKGIYIMYVNVCM